MTDTGYHGRPVNPENFTPPKLPPTKFESAVPLTQPPAWMNAVIELGHDAFERGFNKGFAAGLEHGKQS